MPSLRYGKIVPLRFAIAINRLVFVQKRGILVEIKAREKFYRRRPERSALGVHMVDIPRIKFFAQRRYRAK